MWLQQSDPIFNVGVIVMRPAFNPEPKYRVTMLTGEDLTKGNGSPTAVKRAELVHRRVQDEGGAGAAVYGKSVGRMLSFTLGRYATVFQARYVLSWSVFTKLNCRIDRRNT